MSNKFKSIFVLALAGSAFAFAAQKTVVKTKDWKTFATKDGKFSIKAPKGWGTSNPDDPNSKEADEKFKKNNPQIAAMAEKAPNYDLFLMDIGDPSIINSNNVSVVSAKDSGLTTAMYPQVAQGIIREAKLEKSGWKELELPSGKSVTYWGQLPVVIDEKTNANVSVIGYVVAKGNTVYICTMATSAAEMKVQKPIYEAMAKTIVLK
jgi:hypothetical protein